MNTFLDICNSALTAFINVYIIGGMVAGSLVLIWYIGRCIFSGSKTVCSSTTGSSTADTASTDAAISTMNSIIEMNNNSISG
ncbi:MAG: hypothetical protein K2W82_16370 [Candidatus Obscuribacterales bacterium]|nr:hypothetical protein [Candidatus Obscuribacterales bacterium]